MKPILSIITINRNNSQGLKKTIESVVNQIFDDYEYIVIDGASTDNSIEIISENEASINYWVSEPDNGIYNAMNKGIKRAKGEYVYFLNSGDIFYKNNVIAEIFNIKQTADFLYGGICIKFRMMEFKMLPPKKISLYYFIYNGLYHQSTFTKRELFSELGLYDDSLKIAADYKFIFTAYNVFFKQIKVLPEVIAIYDPYGISSNKEYAEIHKHEKEAVFKSQFITMAEDYEELNKFKRNTVEGLRIRIKHKIIKFIKLF
ncbi:glycosyltransferase family 2 protein [Flavobacterium maritimum]|uniref:glycosyltransferase family 2 protein n=1 Tax=Flavobacterium maritimum TaxID=3149042 RepID=UPI0032B5AD70